MPDANGELVPADVESYTRGRLSADDPETARLLNTALSALRRYCGWRVTPPATETLTVEGSGHPTILLPTLNIVSLTSITVDDCDVDLDDVQVLAGASGVLRLRDNCTTAMSWFPYGGRRCWRRGATIAVELEHGFTDAWDFQAAALELVDRMSSQIGAVVGNSGPPSEKAVDDVRLRWASEIGSSAQLFTMFNHELVDRYRIVQFV